MAEVLCTKFQIRNPLEGGEIRKLLWENDSPTTARGAFDATLSESQDNYDYLEIEATYSTSTTESTIIRFPVFKSDGTEYTYMPLSATYNAQLKGGIVIYNASSATYCRRFVQTDATTINFTTCTQVAGTGTATTGAIPLAIYGIKTNADPTASLISIGSKSNTASPYTMTVEIPEDVKNGVVVLNVTRDSRQPVTSVSITSGTAVLEEEVYGKYANTAAYLETYSIRIQDVTAGSVLTCSRSNSGANFYTYIVYKTS